MTLPEPLHPDRTRALVAVPYDPTHHDPTHHDHAPELPGAGAPRPGRPEPQPPARAAAPRTAAARSAALRLARRAAHTRPGHAVLQASRQVVHVLTAGDREQLAAVQAQLAWVSTRLDDVSSQRVDENALIGRIEANRVNAELLKAEVRGVQRTLAGLGMALAPATGLDGVAERFGELREQVNAVSRRLRQIDPSTGGSPGTARAATPAETPSATPGEEAAALSMSKLDEYFDYVAFERRFRGAPSDVVAVQTQRYADLLARHSPVVDLGCGRGELAEVLAARGTDVIGVEPDAGMVAEARDRGLTVHRTDAATFLRSAEPGSLGAVFSAHVAEHVPFEDLLEIVHLSLDRLAPGGIFVAETPNPAALIVPSNSFILDPTHLRPVHPSLFAFVCETAGFRDVRLDFYAPASGYFLDVPQDDGSPTSRAVAQHATKLNEVLFGHQEYTVVATKAL